MCERCEAIKKEFEGSPEITFLLPTDYFQMLKDANLMEIKADEWAELIRNTGIRKCILIIEKLDKITEIEIFVSNMYIQMVFGLDEVRTEVNKSYHFVNS
jgi:hypothetical protein